MASAGEQAAWEWLRAALANALLKMWEPNGRTHDPVALRRIPAARRNQYAADEYLLAIGALNVVTVAVQALLDDEVARRAATHALRDVGQVLAENLETLGRHPPSWTDA